MPCSSQIISEMLPEIHTMETFDFLKSIIHSQIILKSLFHVNHKELKMLNWTQYPVFLFMNTVNSCYLNTDFSKYMLILKNIVLATFPIFV